MAPIYDSKGDTRDRISRVWRTPIKHGAEAVEMGDLLDNSCVVEPVQLEEDKQNADDAIVIDDKLEDEAETVSGQDRSLVGSESPTKIKKRRLFADTDGDAVPNKLKKTKTSHTAVRDKRKASIRVPKLLHKARLLPPSAPTGRSTTENSTVKRSQAIVDTEDPDDGLEDLFSCSPSNYKPPIHDPVTGKRFLVIFDPKAADPNELETLAKHKEAEKQPLKRFTRLGDSNAHAGQGNNIRGGGTGLQRTAPAVEGGEAAFVSYAKLARDQRKRWAKLGLGS